MGGGGCGGAVGGAVAGGAGVWRQRGDCAREVRGWLRDSRAGAVVEAAVEQLMDWPEVKTDEYRQRQEERKQRFGLAFGIDSGTAIRADRAVRAAQQP